MPFVSVQLPSFSKGSLDMTKDLERAIRHERDEQLAKDRKMHEFERERTTKRGARLSHNVRIEKEDLQNAQKAKRVFSR